MVHSVQTYSVGDLLSLSRRHHGVQPVACMYMCFTGEIWWMRCSVRVHRNAYWPIASRPAGQSATQPSITWYSARVIIHNIGPNRCDVHTWCNGAVTPWNMFVTPADSRWCQLSRGECHQTLSSLRRVTFMTLAFTPAALECYAFICYHQPSCSRTLGLLDASWWTPVA